VLPGGCRLGDTTYTLGRNTGNTFQQTYGHSMVQGVPIKGPLVGTQFPPEDYVAIQLVTMSCT